MLRRLTPPDGEAVLSLEEAKAQCRVLHSEEDTLIASMRDAAVAHIERETAVILAPGEFALDGWCFPRELPVCPVTALGEVTYTGADGVATIYPDARLVNGYLLPARGSEWPENDGLVSVTFTAGMTSLAEVADLLAAVRLLLAHWYANREAATAQPHSDLPLGVRALLHSYLRVGH